MKHNFHNTLVVCGGTAGHIFPAICFAYKYNCTVMLENNGIKYYEKFTQLRNIEINTILFQCKKNNILSIITTVLNNYKNVYYYDKIILFGSFYCIPFLILGVICNKKIIIHEQNAILGSFNFFASFFAYQILSTFQYIDLNNKKVLHFGLPMLHKINYGISKQKYILILTGSQCSDDLENIIDNIIEISHNFNYMIYINTLDHDKYKNIENIVAQPFFDNWEQVIQQAHLVISHSGSSTIRYLILYNKNAILIPLTHSHRNHQIYNAIYSGFPYFIQNNMDKKILYDMIINFFSHKISLRSCNSYFKISE